jgi:hypothetical protein
LSLILYAISSLIRNLIHLLVLRNMLLLHHMWMRALILTHVYARGSLRWMLYGRRLCPHTLSDLVLSWVMVLLVHNIVHLLVMMLLIPLWRHNALIWLSLHSKVPLMMRHALHVVMVLVYHFTWWRLIYHNILLINVISSISIACWILKRKIFWLIDLVLMRTS